MQQQISRDVLIEKYAKHGETTEREIFARVANGLAAAEATPELQAEWEQKFLDNMLAGAIGAGRIMSAAGSGIQATLANCFVQPVGDCIQGVDADGFPGIYEALRMSAETMRRGGGVGYDFSRIRPRGATVKGTASQASGPCSYMDVFDKSCATVESAGARRGAQMGVLRIDHPDVEEFIEAKRTKGRWNNFNVSVGVTDPFMEAVRDDADWDLAHKAKPEKFVGVKTRGDHNVYIYKTVKARDLWDKIMRSAYDFAEPGILFLDRMNQDNNLRAVERLEATNPCVVAGTLVSTEAGYRPVEDVRVGDTIATVDGFGTVATVEVHDDVEVFDVALTDGSVIRATAAHIFHVAQGKFFDTDTRLDQLTIGDRIRLAPAAMPNVKPVSPHKDWSEREFGLVVGVVIGDGCFTDSTSQLKVACNRDSEGWIEILEDLFSKVGHAATYDNTAEVRCVTSTQVARLLEAAGLERAKSNDKSLPLHLLNSNREFLAGFIDGMISTDGNIHMSKSNPMIRVTSCCKESLMMLKRALSFFGVLARVYTTSKAGDSHQLQGRTIQRNHDGYTLAVLGDGIRKIHDLIGVTRPERAERLTELVRRYSLTGCTWAAQVKSITPAGRARVYDLFEPVTDTWITDGVVNRGCGEQPLPPHGCCDLGPIILTKFVKAPFTKNADFDFGAFSKAVEVQVRMLDNVLDVTHWPLPEQQQEAQNKRRIGVGFTGLGDALIMLGLKYDSTEGRGMAKMIAELMRNAAYEASIFLAHEKGAFPLFDAEQYLADGTCASRLPEPLKDAIRENGIRNSHLLSIAPTGTVSLAFADNASNGIEPAYSWTYTRKKREPDGTWKEYTVEDHAYRVYREMGGDVTNLPETFQSALELSVDAHIAMMEVVQPFIDTAISKTVNVPVDYPFDDFKELYMRSWQSRLKGMATYRPNDILGSVLSVNEPKKPEPVLEAPQQDDPMTAVIKSRPAGALPAVSDRIEYWTQDGKKDLYLIVSFLPTQLLDGTWVDRAIEFFMPVGQSGESQQWITMSMRSLSLAARGGFLEAALDDMQKIVWDRGPVRLGTLTKADGTVVPRWHDSEVAAIGFAISELIAKRHAEYEPSGQAAPMVAADTPQPATGKKCSECGAHNVIKKDGCEFCTACGHVGSCG